MKKSPEKKGQLLYLELILVFQNTHSLSHSVSELTFHDK